MSKKVMIGIDPDVSKSGYACLIIDKFEVDCGVPDTWETTKEFIVNKYSFFEIFDQLNTFHKHKDSFYDWKVKVFIEAGWLNEKSNWHVSGKGERVASRVGTKVGANHQVGKLIAEMCEYLGLEYELVRPQTSKMPVKVFRKITGYEGKIDQDGVDAGMLVWGR